MADFIDNFINWGYRTREGAKRAANNVAQGVKNVSQGIQDWGADRAEDIGNWAYRVTNGGGNNRSTEAEAPKQEGPADAPKEEEKKEEKDEGEYVTFTYKPGDTFGRKILELGIATDHGLWGDDGDVAFYTQQLRKQNALDAYGNLKLGKEFKLRKRTD